jgi:hypothetical protein
LIIEGKIKAGDFFVFLKADGSIIFEAEVAGTAEIKFWVLKWGARARVLAPVSL